MAKFDIDLIVFELTGACNQCCKFCYNYWRDSSVPIPPPDPSLARKTLKKLLSQANIKQLSFSGGEPLLINNIHDLALKARFKGSHVNVLTNGTLLTDDAIRNFQAIGVVNIQVPLLSANAAIHESLTNLPGSWSKAADALKRVGGAGIGAAVLVVTKANAAKVTETLSFIRECKIKTVMINRFNIGGNGIRNAKELVPNLAQFKDAFAQAEAFAIAHPQMSFFSGVCTPLCLMDTRPYPHIRFSKCNASLAGRPITVNYNGDVRFCNHSPNVLGNIYKRPIGEILTDPVLNQHYSVLPEACKKCTLLKKCGGGCRAASEQVNGSFDTMDPIVDAVNNA